MQQNKNNHENEYLLKLIEENNPYKQHLEHLLVKACKFLTKEQMQSIKETENYTGLFEWYIVNLTKNCSDNFDKDDPVKEYLSEFSRLKIEFPIPFKSILDKRAKELNNETE
jgi:hypothetical protein